jgi:MSHA pilin protein MshC
LRAGERGFTITELVMVILIAGILAAVAIPRLLTSTFDDARLYDDTLAALRYAHRTAVAYQRTVCATFGSNTLALTYDPTYGGTSCSSSLPPPAGQASSYLVTGSGSASYTAAASFSFDRLGNPTVGQTIALSSGQTITVEAETGYVR